MCGIAGFHRLDGAPQVDRAGILADELLLHMVSRGKDATGILTIDDQGVSKLVKRPIGAFQFVRTRERFASPRTALLHTRWATTGSRTAARDAHPQISGQTAAIHNGTVYNADGLFETFSLPRKAKVDSEIIPALIDHAGWEHAEDALSLMEGGIATAVASLEKRGELILARVRSFPLCYAVLEHEGLLVWASTEHAIRGAWSNTYGTAIPAKIQRLGVGEVIRANGKIEHTTIPGVYGVEKDSVWLRKPAKKTSTVGQAYEAAKAKKLETPPKGKRSSGRLAKRSRKQPPAIAALKADHAKNGSQHTTAEISRLLDQLENVSARLASLELRVTDTETDIDELGDNQDAWGLNWT